MPIEFKRMMVNLLDNAVKFSQPGGLITIDAYQQDHCSIVAVLDEGVGIAQEAVNTIFDRFYSAKPCNDRAKTGLGIGLNIVLQLMQLHNGSVKVSSELGKGSCFKLVFPSRVPSSL